MTEQDEIDWKAVEETKSVMKNKFPMMVQFFLEDTVSYMDQIKKGLESKDAEKIISPSHTIKSTAKQIGVINVCNYAQEIETLSYSMAKRANGNIEDIAQLFEKLELAFRKVEPLLKELAQK